MLAFYCMGEFELIEKYFKVPHARKDVVMGPGDDCALLTLPPDAQLAVSTDTLVSGVHFFPDMDPVDLGYKALAVNLSDLAAMGAEPRWVSLALTLPAINERWVAGFAEGFLELAEYYNVALVGGDMTRGPLSITVSVKGSVPAGRALMRSGAKAGDGVYVTGTLGDAALALSHLLGKRTLNENQLAAVLPRLDHPHPRILAGQALRGLASSALDLSDGLASDLSHILKASGVRAQIDLNLLPLSPVLQDAVPAMDAWQLALAGGDDYELCFTVPQEHHGALDTALANCGVKFTRIGRILAGEPGIDYLQDEQPVELHLKGWDHFA